MNQKKQKSGKHGWQILTAIGFFIIAGIMVYPFISSLKYWNAQMVEVAQEGLLGLAFMYAGYFSLRKLHKTVRDEELHKAAYEHIRNRAGNFRDGVVRVSVVKDWGVYKKISDRRALGAGSKKSLGGPQSKPGLPQKTGDQPKAMGMQSLAASASSSLGSSGSSNSSSSSGSSPKVSGKPESRMGGLGGSGAGGLSKGLSGGLSGLQSKTDIDLDDIDDSGDDDDDFYNDKDKDDKDYKED